MGLQGGGRASLRCSCCTMMAAAFSSARSRALRSTRSCSCSSEAVACHATVTPPSRHRHAYAAGPTVCAADPQAASTPSAPTAAPPAPA